MLIRMQYLKWRWQMLILLQVWCLKVDRVSERKENFVRKLGEKYDE